MREMNTLLGVYGYGDWTGRVDILERHAQEFVRRLQQRECGTIDVEIAYKHSKLNYRKHVEKQLQKALGQLSRGECRQIIVSCYQDSAGTQKQLGLMVLEFGYNAIREQSDANYPNKMEISFCHELLPGLYAQQEWTQILLSLSAALGAATGFVDCARFMLNGSETPMEMPVCFISGTAPEKHYNKKLRGYTWGSVLTKGHIAALGGTEKALQIPHSYSRSITINGEEALYLQATDSLWEFSPEQRLALKKSMGPVLYKEDLFLISGQFWAERTEYWENLIALDEEERKRWDCFVELYKQGTKSYDARKEMAEERKFYGINERGIIVEKEEMQ